MIKKKRIFLAIPLGKGRQLEPEAQESLSRCLYRPSDLFEFRPEDFVIMRDSPNIYYQRHNLAKEFLKTDCDYYLYFDSDQVLIGPDNCIELLIRAGVDIISPLIVRTRFPHIPASLDYKQAAAYEDHKFHWPDYRDKKEYPSDIIEVKYSSGGVCLISRRVLEDVKKPFMPVWAADGSLMSTDYGFYKKAREKGYKSYIHRGVECGHIGRYIFTPAEYYGIKDQGDIQMVWNEETSEYDVKEKGGYNEM